MKEIFFKFLGALREHRPDMAGIALFHLVLRLCANLIHVLTTPFSKENTNITLLACVCGLSTIVIRLVSREAWDIWQILAEFAWIPAYYLAFLAIRGLQGWLKDKAFRTGLKLDNYQPRKRKEKTFTREQLAKTLEESDPGTRYYIGDDGELTPVTGKQH